MATLCHIVSEQGMTNQKEEKESFISPTTHRDVQGLAQSPEAWAAEPQKPDLGAGLVGLRAQLIISEA